MGGTVSLSFGVKTYIDGSSSLSIASFSSCWSMPAPCQLNIVNITSSEGKLLYYRKPDMLYVGTVNSE